MHDTLLAIIPRNHLNTALSTFHREGYGPVIRVFDADRAPLGDQCERAGIGQPESVGRCTPTDVVIMVNAPKRLHSAAAIAVACGAHSVELVVREMPLLDRTTGQIVSLATERRTRRSVMRAPMTVSDDVHMVAD